MTQLDQFESVFKSAVKETYKPESIKVERVLVVTDLDAYPTELLTGQIKAFLRGALGDTIEWMELGGEGYSTVIELLAGVEEKRPDLIVTYRNLKQGAPRPSFSVGVYIEALTQATTTPILVLPDPGDLGQEGDALANTHRVMVITDHLTGDNHLVSVGARFTDPGGTLYLAHVEDDAIFERYLEVIGKISTIDTELARQEIGRVLLKEPADFIKSCKARLEGSNLHLESVVRMGHRLQEYESLIGEHEIDLLVFNTKDDTQLAMHGLAHPLAVELRRIPLLML